MAGLDNLGHRNCVIKMPLAHNCSAELYLINSLVYAIEKIYAVTAADFAT